MKTGSDFTVDEMEKLVTISNLMGISLPIETSASVDFYLSSIIKNLKEIPYIPYKTSLHCIDIAILRKRIVNEQEIIEVLLGKKSNARKYQFIGGFLDPAEASDACAIRESLEETNLDLLDQNIVETDSPGLQYIGSYFINDERLLNSPHKLTTSFYAFSYVKNDVISIAKDDIEHTAWFNVDELSEIMSKHLVLLNVLLRFLKK